VPDVKVVRDGRVFRVIVCESCHWQYGCWWPRAEVYPYWGDCPQCGCVTKVADRWQWSKVETKRVATQLEMWIGAVR